MVAVLLYKHWHLPQGSPAGKDLIALWGSIYPDNVLPRRKARGKNKKSKN